MLNRQWRIPTFTTLTDDAGTTAGSSCPCRDQQEVP